MLANRKTNLLLIVLAAFVPAAKDQIPRNNPLVEASHAIGVSGLGLEAKDRETGWAFQPDKSRLFVKEFTAALAQGESRQAELEKGILAVMEVYEKGAKKMGQANDPANALAFSVEELYAYDHGREVDKDEFLALIPRFRATLAKIDATDRQKQEFYEYALCAAGSTLTLAAGAKDDDAKARVKGLAETLLLALVGARPDAIVLDGSNVEIKGAASVEPAPAAAKDASPNVHSVVGEWRWFSTGSLTNWNLSDGTYAGAGRSMTKRYAFAKDGTFKTDSLIQINSSGHRTSAFITYEGRYELRGDTIRFIVLKGRQHGEDNLLSAGNYDRPMPKEVMDKIPETVRYTVRTEGGKPAFVLLLTSNAKDDMVFKAVDRR